MSTLEHLVSQGYRGVAWRVVNDARFASGSPSRVTVYEVWARGSDNAHRRFTLTEAMNGHEPAKRSIGDETAISEEEYAQAVRAHGGMRDTAAWIAEREKRRRRIHEINIKIAVIMPRCPLCNDPMVIRSRAVGVKLFFACKGFPRTCRGRSAAPRHLLRRINALCTEREKLR